jgi:hypothetical protein
VGSGGGVLDGSGFQVATGAPDQSGSSVAGGSSNQLVAFQRSSGGGTARVFFKLLG